MRGAGVSLASALRILRTEEKVYNSCGPVPQFPFFPFSVPTSHLSPLLPLRALASLACRFQQHLYTLTLSLLIPTSLDGRRLATSPLGLRSHTSYFLNARSGSTSTSSPSHVSSRLSDPAQSTAAGSSPRPSFSCCHPSRLPLSAPSSLSGLPAIRPASLPYFLLPLPRALTSSSSRSYPRCPTTLPPSIAPSQPQHEAQSASSNTTSPSLPPPPPLQLAVPPSIAPRPPSHPPPTTIASTQMTTKSARGWRR